jgi:hypothetical protein
MSWRTAAIARSSNGSMNSHSSVLQPRQNGNPRSPGHQWEAAHGEFVKTGRGQQGEWKFREPAPKRWMMQRKNLKFWVEPAPSGHVGVFPDQACHWDWIEGATRLASDTVRLLCLFGHTGLAALAAAAAGAQVMHVDASRKAVAWARENWPWRTPDPLDCGRRVDIRQARGATRESIQRAGARSTQVRARSRWRDLEIRGFSAGIAGRMCQDSEHSTRVCSAECLCHGADRGTDGKGSRRIAFRPQNAAWRTPDNHQRRRVGDSRRGRAKNFHLRFRQGSAGEMIRNRRLRAPCQKRTTAEGFNSSKA